MAGLWIVFILLCALLEVIASDYSLMDDILDPPFFKSLGYTIQKAYDSKTLDEAKLNQEFMYKYSEMLKAGQDSLENVARKESDKRLRRVVGNYNYEMMKEAGLLDRRRNARLLESAAAKRRIRTQALRRNKLNSQSQWSHQHHSKKHTTEYAYNS